MKACNITIELEGMRFYAYHGVLDQETKVGNHFVVSLQLVVEVQQSLRSDALEDTLNYADAYDCVAREMQIPSKLLEHVSGRIVSALFHQFPQVQQIALKLTKLNPPFRGDVSSASVSISTSRE